MEPTTQENRELNLVRRFDFFTILNGPQRGSVVLHFLGFGVVMTHSQLLEGFKCESK